ncbi:response regulator [Dyadobacter pollutisoli]|uniref:Response regulator n=2 Tax=Dyadobacter pollutisoli TaxID=2910158 RepID=A0A9E8N5R2_9BACT|nr:response regulator [Dyadobacter pollutisoli]WAC10330.1 response regulator [Dyadobacter pollutisoli]
MINFIFLMNYGYPFVKKRASRAVPSRTEIADRTVFLYYCSGYQHYTSLSSEPMNPMKPFRILLAEDDDDDTFLFQEALEQIPIKAELTVTENGMELMKVLKSGVPKPDLIFLDMNMPVKNGLECLEDIRNFNGFENIPIVILSTSVARYLWESAYKNGANRYVQKPTSFTGLVEILKKCISPENDASPDVEQFLITN